MFQKSKQHLEEKARSLILDAGYSSPTGLQRKVIPALLQEKDTVVETQFGEGRTASFLIPIILQTQRYSGPGPYGLIISAHPESVRKTTVQLSRFVRNYPVSFIGIGYDSTIKKEAKQLRSNPQIIIGTARRIIDHLRRNTIHIRHIKCVILNFELSDKSKGFDKDIQFILSKVAKRTYMGIFSSCIDNIEPLLPFLKRPQILTSDDWDSKNVIQNVYLSPNESDKKGILNSLIIAKEYSHTVIYCRTMAVLKSVEKVIAVSSNDYAIFSIRTSEQKQSRMFQNFEKGRLRYILTVCLNLIPKIPGIQEMIFYSIPDESGQYSNICTHIAHSTQAKITALFTKEESEILELLQEKHKMKRKNHPADEDVIKGKLKAILQRIHEADPDELQKYKKLIKKHIPLTRRAYVSALLFKESVGTLPGISGPQTTLFVNIGKNRRVYPRDLSRFFSKSLNIDQNEIGAIRVLDNYSFIEVPEAIAQNAVAKMDGTEFRGRKIVVNFAKKKD